MTLDIDFLSFIKPSTIRFLNTAYSLRQRFLTWGSFGVFQWGHEGVINLSLMSYFASQVVNHVCQEAHVQ